MSVKQLELSAKQKEFIASEIKAGRYRDQNQILLAGLELLAKRQRIEKKRAMLRELIQPALDQLDRGECTTFHTKEELTAHFDALKEKALKSLRKPAV